MPVCLRNASHGFLAAPQFVFIEPARKIDLRSAMPTQESQIEEKLIEKLRSLKYEYREDIRDRAALEENTNTGALVRRLLSDDYADKVIVTTIQRSEIQRHSRHRLHQ